MSDEQHKSPERLPTAREILAEVTELYLPTRGSSEHQYLESFREGSADIQETYAHLEGLRDHYKHKSRWSNFLMFVMAAMIGFQSVLLGLVGASVWDFSKYQWLLPALLVQNLAQIIGLAVFVVKALFKDVKR